MIRPMWKKLPALFMVTLAMLTGGGLVSGQEIDLQKLQERLERLEKQNDELKRQLQGAPVSTNSEAGGEIDQKSVEKIIGSYLKKQDEAKKKAEAAKAQEFGEVGSDMSLKGKWSNGISYESPLKDFKFHIGGRVHFDMGWHAPDEEANFDPFHDAMGFRRARLKADGTFWEVFNWSAEFEFAGGTVLPTDVFVEVTQLPILGTFRAGHFKQYFSLEQLTSSRYTTFMDRTLFNEAFNLGFRPGVGFSNAYADDLFTLSAGFFRNQAFGTSMTDFGDGEYDYVARATICPLYEEEGRCSMHFGAAYKHAMYETDANAGGAPVVYRARTLRIGDGSGTQRIIQASGGALTTVDYADYYGGEFAAVWGPLSIQAEVAQVQNDNDTAGGANPMYWGSYVQVSYFLTGEHRPYNRKTAAFDRVKVNEPFFLVNGPDEEGRRLLFGKGAWELAARWDYLDLRSAGVVRNSATAATPPTGVLQDFVLGVNWYWTSNAKVMFNYVRAWRDSDRGPGAGSALNRDGTVDSFGIRFAWDF